MATPQEILESMGLDPNEAERVDRELTQNARVKDKRICLCGHAVGRHDMTLGRPICVVGRMECKCKNLQPILAVSDTRPFIRKTEGSSLNHALSRGIAAAMSAGCDIDKIEDEWACHKCGVSGEAIRLTPVAVTANGVPTDYDSGYNALFCDDCRTNH
jgi:hypothetical protein